ncbi:MAG: bifunctional diaminohydroxyphosphoribosylaminopyrimidine deaminase/5-amino-6-(5-phosphoribosylamino)uracil reductase RibD [Agriterribacter sp.]
MHRCLQLAKLGLGNVAPNPMVGAVLVYNDSIIGEGYHRQYGEAHAEVNCIQSVKKEDEHLIPQSRLYVSLEPCAHYGKTPPCADLIIHHHIPEVIIGCRDPFAQVDGKGIDKLKAAGVHVVLHVLEQECKQLNKRFFIFHTKHRPCIILKWAQSTDGFIAANGKERVYISNDYTNRLVHRWRSEEAGILVGTNTALLDNPQLTARLWEGKSPVRLVVDMDLKLPGHLALFDTSAPTIVFNTKLNTIASFDENIFTENKTGYYQVTEDVSIVHQIVHALYQLRLQSVIVEGGAKLLQSFIDEGMWDEARIIRNATLTIHRGIKAPSLTDAIQFASEKIDTDEIDYYSNSSSAL